MKKAIVGTLAVIGGITVVFTAFVGIASAVQTARAKKKYESMTPEEREEHNRRVNAVISAIASAYGTKQEEAPEETTDEPTGIQQENE